MSQVKKSPGPRRYGDGTVAMPRLTDEGASVVGEGCGKYYELCLQGNLFNYQTAVAGIVLNVAAAAGNFTIWNPAGSGKNFIPLIVRIGVVSGAAGIAGFIGYFRYPNAGANIGLPFSVFTDIAIASTYLGGPTRKVPITRFSTTNTLPGAPTFIRTANFTMLQARTGNATIPFKMVEDLNGEIVIPPGTTFSIAANAAIALTCAICVTGAELPIPLEA